MTIEEAVSRSAREALALLDEVGRTPRKDAPARLLGTIKESLRHVTEHHLGTTTCTALGQTPNDCAKVQARYLAAATALLYALLPGEDEPDDQTFQ